ncbi:beta strand repeat-containing protein [Verrucomicrobiota bacterium sgz303538]
MKTRRSVLSRLWQKCFPGTEKGSSQNAEPARLLRAEGTGTRKSDGASRPRLAGIEMLEGRIAPATLINPTTVVFTDVDGDHVTVKFSKPIFSQVESQDLATVLNNVFKFSTGNIGTDAAQDTGTGQQLQLIDLTRIPLVGDVGHAQSPATAVSITVTADKVGSAGNSLTDVGAIIATNAVNSFGLGKITIDGDLGQIDAGSSSSPVGVVALKVNSLGVAADSQPSGTGNPGFPNYESKIMGSLGSLTVLGDVKGAWVNVVSGSGLSNKAIGKIGNVTIGGSLIGTAAVAATSDNTGLIQSATIIGNVKIGSGVVSNDSSVISDGIIGGGGKNSGAIVAAGKISSVTINGDLLGGGGDKSGTINATGGIGSVKVGVGSAGHGIVGGAGATSGAIIGGGKLGAISVNGDLLGGTGESSGVIITTSAANGDIASVKITGKIGVIDHTTETETGTQTVLSGVSSARIYAKGNLGSVTVGGDVQGGSRAETGTIVSDGKMGVVTIGGNLLGGIGDTSNTQTSGLQSGGIFAGGKLTGVNIAGSLLGGTGQFSGFIQGNDDIGFVKIGHDLKGNTDVTAVRSGIIASTGSIDQVTIGGSIIGGKGDSSGSIQAALSGTGTLNKVTVGKQLLGGDGFGSATITSGNKIGSVAINGAGTDVAVQGKGQFSASIYSEGTIGEVKITGDVAGGDGDDSASIQSNGLLAKLSISGDLKGGKGARSGSIGAYDVLENDAAGDLGKLTIGGTVTAGEGARSGAIYADGNLVSATLGGLDVGTFTTGTPGAGSASIATGLGILHAGDAGKITVNGSMNGHGGNHTLVEIHGSLGSLSVRSGIANGDIHVAGNLGKLAVGTSGKHGVEADLENVVLTAGGIAPTSAKLATVIASITVSGDVTNSQILAGYDLTGQGTNADAQIGSVKVSGNWNASDLVAGVIAVNGEFGDADDAVIAGGSSDITSRIANVIIGGSVSGSADPTTDHFGFVAQQIGTVKVGKLTIPDSAVNDLADDVTVREIAVS